MSKERSDVVNREVFLKGVELSIEEVRVAIATAALKKAGVTTLQEFETLGLYPQAKGVLLIVGPVKANFEDGARAAVNLSSRIYLGAEEDPNR